MPTIYMTPHRTVVGIDDFDELRTQGARPPVHAALCPPRQAGPVRPPINRLAHCPWMLRGGGRGRVKSARGGPR